LLTVISFKRPPSAALWPNIKDETPLICALKPITLLSVGDTMPNVKGMNVQALMKLQVDERLLAVAIGVGGAIALAIIGYLLHWISS
jgi:hypothetical protein